MFNKVNKTYRYFLTQRPFTVGSVPKMDKIVNSKEFMNKSFVPTIGQEAWGYVEYRESLDKDVCKQYELKEATITNVKPLGSGDRVCVDTTSMMQPGEGMLIGSYSKALFLVHSESLESEYVASRPFRVNAGPVQAYVMVPGNKTRYLAELKAGDEVLIVNTEGETRTAYVGRSKIEKRPLLLVEAEYEGTIIRTLLQNAETIRIVDSDNNPISVAELKVGDKVKVYIETSARHFGIAIDETIIEQ